MKNHAGTDAGTETSLATSPPSESTGGGPSCIEQQHVLPHNRSGEISLRYVLTADGIRIAVFYTKIYNRLLVPLTAANQPQAPPDLRAALAAITRHVDDYATRARLPRAA